MSITVELQIDDKSFGLVIKLENLGFTHYTDWARLSKEAKINVIKGYLSNANVIDCY